MLAEMPAPLFAEWCEFFSVEPFGPAQEDLRAGLVASILFNANRGSGQQALKPWDFFGSLRDVERAAKMGPEQTPEEMHAAMLGWVAALGGTFKGKGWERDS